LQNNIAYKYDNKTNNFITVSKNELLDEIINERLYDINEFYNEYKDDITNKMQSIIEKFISNMSNEDYELRKKNDVKLIIYNNRDKVSKEIVQNLEIIV
jgi:hypothetical protein